MLSGATPDHRIPSAGSGQRGRQDSSALGSGCGGSDLSPRTLVRDAADEATRPSLLGAIRDADPLVVRLTDVQCWGTAEDGIFVGVLDIRGDVARVRELLGVVEPPNGTYVPHVTVVHPRTVPAVTLRAAWDALSGWTLDADVVLDRVSVVELVDAGWRVVDEVTLNPR